MSGGNRTTTARGFGSANPLYRKLALSAAVVTSVSTTARPAHAQVAAFVAFLGYVKTGYDVYNKYLVNHQTDLAQLQALITASKSQIIGELDGLTAAWNSSCAANAVDTFQNINALSPDNLQAFAIS